MYICDYCGDPRCLEICSTEKQEHIEDVIKRVENYPCCMSCYVTAEEMKAGKAMKEAIIKILKDGLI